MGINSEAILNHKFLEMAKLLNVYLNHFPKHEKYALANNIRNTAYCMYDLITECQKRYFKKTSLTELDIVHEKLRMQIYLANELGYFGFKDGKESQQANSVKRFIALTKLIDELGRMIGAWINKLKNMANFK
ncbi:MAG: four helix bundle protein [Sulfurovaceae bacterium]|nr:four helix bundle protein [Sulfurovaceae bacterium]